MQRVSDIRARRERVFYKNRMKGNKERQLAADRKLVEENQHLLPPRLRDAVEVEAEDVDQKMEVEPRRLEQEAESESEEELRVKPTKVKTKKKQRLVRGVGAEDMDMD